MKAFILAGGFATRLWPLTEHRAKPMLLVDGRPIVEHLLRAIPPEIEVFLLTNSRFAPDFERYLQTQDRPVRVYCEDAHSDAQKLGALAAVAQALQDLSIEDDLLILAGDNVMPELDISLLCPGPGEARLAYKTLEDRHQARSFGVLRVHPNSSSAFPRVESFVEKPSEPNSNLVSTGFMGLSVELLPIIKTFAHAHPDALGGIIPQLLRLQKVVRGVEVPGPWFDVGSFSAYLGAHKNLQSVPVKVDSTAQVDNCRFEGKVYVGAQARVTNSVLVDTVVYPGCVIEDCRLGQTILDRNCHLTGVDLSHKLVREGTTLQAEQKV